MSMVAVEDEHDWDCECDQCHVDDEENYAIYRFDDARNLEMWVRYRRNHPNGLPLP